MPRRGHRKSRAGCADCKRRHVKCDETRPSCVNCKVASLRCSYTKSSGALDPNSTSAEQTPPYSPLTPDTTSSTTARHEEPLAPPLSMQNVNMTHLELLHHYETDIYQSFTTNQELATVLRDTAVSSGLRFPFLMHALLALSAMHLSRIRPERSTHYRTLASTLQASALTGLKDSLLNISEDNCVAIFIFSTTTGLHSFCEAFCYRESNFNSFLDKLTDSIALLRGVRSVMDGGWWDFLGKSSLAGLLASGAILGSSDVERNKETKPLWELLAVSDLGTSSFQTYEKTVTNLQRVFRSEAKNENAQASVSMVFAWPVMLDTDYTDLLVQRRPEALIILAYYGVVLHRRQKAWAIGDSGQFLVNAIHEYLGKHWERWLVWPRAMIAGSPDLNLGGTPT